MSRFQTTKHFASYSGMVPRVHQSGDVARTGGIDKERLKRFQATMIRYANVSIKSHGKFRCTFNRLKMRNKSHGTALVAVAWKMLEVVLVILNRECDYVDSDKLNTHRKIRKTERIPPEMRNVDIAATIEGLSDRPKEILGGDYKHTLIDWFFREMSTTQRGFGELVFENDHSKWQISVRLLFEKVFISI